MAPDAKPCGTLIAGTHPAAVDCVAATVMGFEWRKLPLLRKAFEISALNFTPFAAAELLVRSDQSRWNKPLAAFSAQDVFHFRPHFGWTGAIEWEQLAEVE